MSTADSSIIIIDCKKTALPRETQRENKRQIENGGRQGSWDNNSNSVERRDSDES